VNVLTLEARQDVIRARRDTESGSAASLRGAAPRCNHRNVGDTASFDYDAVVIGTGFGGSVTAARLTEAGARVLILERGMRYEGEAFPALPRDGQALADPARFVWSSEEGRLGLWDIRDLGGTHAASAAGYGGGSLVYASVHLRAPDEVLKTWPQSAERAYSRAALDPYYDLAAYMLEVDTIESAPDKLYPLRKTSALRAAAAQLGRAEQAFFPPLAVRFHPGEDLLGQKRPGCVGCGECNSGCRHGAKNTLDQNYLAIAERMRAGDAPRSGFAIGGALAANEPLAVVRTLAEARTITRERRGGQDGFRVEFWDHAALDYGRPAPLRGRIHHGRPPKQHGKLDEVAGPRDEQVTARFVFVCAGALGSTELLLRNREALGIHSKALGQKYFGNSDALGIVRNTQHVHQPHVGPVITTALVHRGATPDEPWLMIQDGGYGAAVHALVEAVFASPVLAQRNRFYEAPEQGAAPAQLGGPEPIARPHLDPPAPVRRNASLAEGLYHAELAHELIEIIPEQLAEAAIALRRRAEGFVAADVEKTVDALEQFVVRGGAYRFAKLVEGTAAFPLFERAALSFLRWLARGVRKMTAAGALAEIERLAAQRQPTSEDPKQRAAIERFVREHPIGVATMLVMQERFKLRDQRVALVEGLKLLTSRASDPESYAKSLDHTAVLLTMGRDRQRHSLSLCNGVLKAEVVPRERGEPRLYSVQERLMREVASVMGGELRLNPAWSQAHTPITVHGQGGCGMHEDPEHGVTDLNGEVHGCRGLFVIDAALFPSPVGVNPSATILAVAERNIETFIRRQPGLERFVAREAAAVAQISPERRARLTPEPIDSVAASRDIDTQAVGIRFEEQMYGFHASSHNAPPAVHATPEDRRLDGTHRTERLYSQLEACYVDGRVAGDALELMLEAKIEDLSAFIGDPNHRGKLSGMLRLTSRDPSSANTNLHPRLRELIAAAGGTLHVRDGEIEVMAKVSKDERLFRYLLTFHSPVPGSPGLVLEGHKRVRDEPGQDEWQDTTALFFWLGEIDHYRGDYPVASKTARSHGIVRVSLDEFLTRQLPSMNVIGVRKAPQSEEPDPANVIWGLATFGAFFFGSLADVYMKEAALVTRVIKRSLALGGEL
jgi:choline dehydrogenase-like flavoprotein